MEYPRKEEEYPRLEIEYQRKEGKYPRMVRIPTVGGEIPAIGENTRDR
ncbi:hypothetical protein LSPCS325_22760 [Lysinibacillus sp. CTST325]